jgi:hypothetical protein
MAFHGRKALNRYWLIKRMGSTIRICRSHKLADVSCLSITTAGLIQEYAGLLLTDPMCLPIKSVRGITIKSGNVLP